MDSNPSSGKLRFDFTLGSAAQGRRPDPEIPFRLLIAADFSGRASRGLEAAVAGERIRQIDCDNFEKAMTNLKAALRLEVAGTPVEVCLSKMEDFHPDSLCRRVPALANLQEQRLRLLDPASAPAAAAELASLLQSPPAPVPPSAESSGTKESNTETLARLLGGGPAGGGAAAAPSPPRSGLAQLLQNAVASSIVAGATPQQTAVLSAVELELTNRLRSLLHQAAFQGVEASWRGLDLLVGNFGAEENLKLYLLDISKEELAADLMARADPAESGIYRVLRAGSEDAPWAAWIGLFPFGNTPADVELLGRLAKISAGFGAPFLGSGQPSFVGCDSFDAHPDPDDWTARAPAEAVAAWQALRALPEAAFLGLATPRFLLRQPYGKTSDAIESFPFEEFGPQPVHEHYLWGNPALVCAYLLSAAFQAEGWEMRAEGYGELTELPVHQFREADEVRVKPCAEAWLSERAAETIQKTGLMALLSIKGRDAVRLARMQSVSAGGHALAGCWQA